MPSIREYTNQATLHPDERSTQAYSRIAGAQGAEAGALGAQAGAVEQLGQARRSAAEAQGAATGSIGRAVGSTIQTLGDQYVNWRTQHEISQGAAEMAAVQQSLTMQWNDMAAHADPNDHTLQQRFNDEVLAPVLEKFGQGFQTEQAQKWGQQQVLSTQQHFFEKTSADMATLAGNAMVQNFDVLKNRASNMVMTDPTSVNMALGLVDNSIEAMVGGNPSLTAAQASSMKGELRQNLKTEVVKSAVIGLAEINPAAAKQQLASGKFADYLDGNETKSLSAYADTVAHAQDAQAKAAAAAQKQQDEKNFTTAQNQLAGTLIGEDGSLLAPGPDFYKGILALASMPGADKDTVQSLTSYAEAQTKRLMEKAPPPIKTDPYVYSQFAERAVLPDSDPRALTLPEVLRARTDGRLSDEDFKHYSTVVAKPESEKKAGKDLHDYTESLKGWITKSSMLNVDAIGNQRFYEFQSNATALAATLKAAGKTDEQIKAAIYSTLSKYTVPAKVSQAATIAQATGGLQPIGRIPSGGAAPHVEPRKAGESAADYMKRTGGK